MELTWLDRRIVRLFKDNPGFSFTVLCMRQELNLFQRDVPQLKARVFALREAGILVKDGKMFYKIGDLARITAPKREPLIKEGAEPGEIAIQDWKDLDSYTQSDFRAKLVQERKILN